MIERGGDEVEFYVPATFQFSTEAGRVERVLVGLFRERGQLEVRTFTGEETTEPGRIERFLRTVFEERGDAVAKRVPEEFADYFYLPASNPDGYRRQVEQQSAPLAPASEIAGRSGKPGGN